MRCSRCDNELAPTARYCGRCGVTLSPSHIEREVAESPAAQVSTLNSKEHAPEVAPAPVEASVQSGGGVLLLEAPPEERPSPHAEAPIEDRMTAEPIPDVTVPPPMVRRRPTAVLVALLVAAVVAAGLVGAVVGHMGTASAAAETTGLRARLADSATAQARLTDQVTAMTHRLASQKATEPLRRLVGKRAGEVQSYAKAHGWRVRIVRVPSARPSGTVLTQAPPAGHVMKQGGTIVVHAAA
jgi:PASTA domain